jgi:hypothetical protein
MTGALIGVAVLGWLLCVAGAILSARGATRLKADVDDVPYVANLEDGRASAGLWLTLVGALLGLIGTVWSLLV